MLDPEAREEIATVPPDASCTFVIEWREAPTAALFPSSSSKRDRLDRLIQFYRNAKAPLVGELADAGVSITDLPTSSQIVATAPARTWRRLVSKLEDDPNLAVLPNRVYTAV